jgi:cell wall-associated NlpC family hydrolase
MMMNLSPHASAASWPSRWVGRAWAPHFNCWHLVQQVQREVFGRDMPALPVGTPEDQRETLQRITKRWRPTTDAPREGDLLTMTSDIGPHVGVLVSADRVLHNVGGQDGNRIWGCVRVDAIDELGNNGYGHLKLWRAV